MTRDLVPTSDRLAELAQDLLSTRELFQTGLTERNITSRVRSGELARLRQGAYLHGARWSAASPADRHLTAMIAAQQAATNRHVFSHRSAATLHGLPAWSAWLARIFGSPVRGFADPKAVEVTHPMRHGSQSEFMIHHRGALSAADIVTAIGFSCTSPERTVIDLARTEPFGIALACTDALLRHMFRLGRQLDTQSWRSWQAQLIDYTLRHRGHRGMSTVRVLAALADPRSDSPLESVSRLRFLQLGIPVELQTPVPAEDNGTLYLDFTFPGLNIFGECDGRAKYTDEDLLGDQTPTEVLLKEKDRHDWVTGSTKMRGVRWGASHVTSAAVFAKRLRAFGIPVPGFPSPELDRETRSLLHRLR